MNQYYQGKQENSLISLKTSREFRESLFFNDSLEENHEYNNLNFERCTFSTVSFKKSIIQYSKFSHCIFIGCYFKNSYLNKIDFINCTFIECGFYKEKIEDCKFFFTEWVNSYIKFDELYNNLPNEYNYRKKLCKSMAQNCLKSGNITEYKKYFWEEKNSTENHYKEIVLRRKEYYCRNYNRYDAISYIFRFVECKFNRMIWGYGESLHNIILSGIVTISIFSFIYYYAAGSLINSLYLSICNFLTINCSYSINNSFINWVSVAESFCGLAFMGLFIAVLFRNINSR